MFRVRIYDKIARCKAQCIYNWFGIKSLTVSVKRCCSSALLTPICFISVPYLSLTNNIVFEHAYFATILLFATIFYLPLIPAQTNFMPWFAHMNAKSSLSCSVCLKSTIIVRLVFAITSNCTFLHTTFRNLAITVHIIFTYYADYELLQKNF